MARHHQFRIWPLALAIITLAHEDLQRLRGEADLRNQIKRSSRSIAANIAEGAGRRTDRDFRYFLSIARGSVAELGSWYEMLGALGFIDDARLALVVDRCDHLGRSLSRLIARLAGGT